MALNGISLTLAPVQEMIWTEVYTELGLTTEEIDDHFAGPGFFAWQRMGNIRGWGGPLTSDFKKMSSDLQKQVIQALRDLGVAVALPAFAGILSEIDLPLTVILIGSIRCRPCTCSI